MPARPDGPQSGCPLAKAGPLAKWGGRASGARTAEARGVGELTRQARHRIAAWPGLATTARLIVDELSDDDVVSPRQPRARCRRRRTTRDDSVDKPSTSSGRADRTRAHPGTQIGSGRIVVATADPTRPSGGRSSHEGPCSDETSCAASPRGHGSRTPPGVCSGGGVRPVPSDRPAVAQEASLPSGEQSSYPRSPDAMHEIAGEPSTGHARWLSPRRLDGFPAYPDRGRSEH